MGRKAEAIFNGGVCYNVMCACGWGFNGNPDRMKKILAMHAKKCDKFSGIHIPTGLQNVIGNFPNQQIVHGITYNKNGMGQLFDASDSAVGRIGRY